MRLVGIMQGNVPNPSPCATIVWTAAVAKPSRSGREAGQAWKLTKSLGAVRPLRLGFATAAARSVAAVPR